MGSNTEYVDERYACKWSNDEEKGGEEGTGRAGGKEERMLSFLEGGCVLAQ